MGKKADKTNLWVKPEAKRLGQIKDVAGNSGIGGQQGNNKS